MLYVTRWYEERKKLEEEHRRNTEAELVWLKNQLNPHFLFNTLNNISSLVTVDAEKAQDSICQLSDLLRYTLYESNAAKVKVREEIGFMRNYIDLMSLRCNDKTRVDGQFRNIDYSDILYVSAMKDYVVLKLQSDPSPVVVHITMKSIEEQLPSSRFMRVHRSYIVAVDKISSIDGSGDIMLADELIPVSESYRKNVDDFLADRLFVAKERREEHKKS